MVHDDNKQMCAKEVGPGGHKVGVKALIRPQLHAVRHTSSSAYYSKPPSLHQPNLHSPSQNGTRKIPPSFPRCGIPPAARKVFS